MDFNLEHGYLEGIGTREEWATIYYALEDYKSKLKQTLDDAEGTPTQHEDETFCYQTLGTISNIQFDLLENHEREERKTLRTWLDVR